MPTNSVMETAAAKSISAKIIFNKKGEMVGKVLAHFGNSGGVLVNVVQREFAVINSLKARGKPHENYEDCEHMYTQSARAGGYGYDKFTAALSGMIIDGHEMTNHCSCDGAPKPPRGRVTYARDAKPKKGYTFANHCTMVKIDGKWVRLDHQLRAYNETYNRKVSAAEARGDVESGYDSCYRKSGLDYLGDFGYAVYEVI